MVLREDLPEVGEIVVATVVEVQRLGARVMLDEYKNVTGYVPINEITSGWVKNIRDYLNEGKKVVGVVIDVNKNLRSVTISLRRITDAQRKRKLIEWKRTQRGYKLLEIVAQRVGMSLEEAYKKFGRRLESVFGSIYRAFEEAAMNPNILKKEKFRGKWVSVFVEVAQENITTRRVYIDERFYITTTAPDGVERIKNCLTGMLSVLEKEGYENVDVHMIYEGAPKYRIRVIAPEYPLAEKVLKDLKEFMSKCAKENELEVSSERVVEE
ncbi:MAG: translation initiation factor IF-2 subunit alpha [Thermoplasmata archaeon]|nr:MAG: translation initiation factor IF-2 subunit alpha [Thermoplasmata archaeon]